MGVTFEETVQRETALNNLAHLREELRLIEGRRGRVHVDPDCFLIDVLTAIGLDQARYVFRVCGPRGLAKWRA